MKKPQMMWIIGVKSMQAFQALEKTTPAASKLGSDLDPEAFDSGVTCGSWERSVEIEKNRNCAYGPQRNEPRFGPRYFIIHTDTSIFSPPLSPRALDGAPYC